MKEFHSESRARHINPEIVGQDDELQLQKREENFQQQ